MGIVLCTYERSVQSTLYMRNKSKLPTIIIEEVLYHTIVD